MATKEDQETLRLLVQHVSRAFYEPKYTIILDQLARHPVLKDDDLAGRMGLQSKELNKLMAVLSNDCLVKIYRQNELKEGAQRSVGKQYYYIDYEYFCNVVKWRVARMRQIIDSTLRNEIDNKGYICPQCKMSYSALDVDKLMDFALGTLVCEVCRAEVVDNEDAESVLGSKDRMQRFNNQMRFIAKGLKESEGMVLPAFDVAAWVKSNPTDGDKQKGGNGSGLRIAGSGGESRADDGIGVVIAMDKDEATRRSERDAEAAAKRQQNALPAWHLKSTITGDLTALGVKENARTTAAEEQLSSNDDILRGLGVVGGGRQEQALVAVEEDVKPVVNHESDYYDQYYATLAASSASSTLDTPSGLSAPGGSDFGLDDEEEEKPAVEYLDSLNDYRKRSRSREDEGTVGQTKMAKTEPYTNGNGNGYLGVNGYGYRQQEDVNMITHVDVEPADDPIVYVNGAPIPFSKVTEEDHDLMTPDEYTAFFEVLQERS